MNHEGLKHIQSSSTVLAKSSEHIFKNEYINKGIIELSLEGISIPADMMDNLMLLDAGEISREAFFATELKKAKMHETIKK